MNSKSIRWLSVLLVALLIIPWSTLAGDPWANVRWKVNVRHDLDGGSWPDGMEISPYQLQAEIGKSMPADGLDAEKLVIPYRAESIFLGWSVLFTNAQDGTIIFNSGDEIWDLNHPFDYYPGNPLKMNCLMTARWQTLQKAEAVFWKVNVSHHLDGGSWPDGMEISPYQLKAEIGKSMPKDSLDAEKLVVPHRAESTFLGWSVLFTNAQDGTIIFNSGDEIWDLNHPFDYYPGNPLKMNCLMTARWQAQEQPEATFWRVNISHDLSGGQWPQGKALAPRTMQAKLGESMAHTELQPERGLFPNRGSDVFLGWSVLFTNPHNGTVIYNSGNEVWNLNQPFDYYPGNPTTMNCVLIARWKPGGPGGSGQPTEMLPDGRTLTRPFAVGTAPLPAIPPPADTIIPGTEWFTSVLICALQEWEKAPVYAFPVWNGPVIDWVGLDDVMDYGLYLSDGWVMLYHPRWVESGGIGFISHEVIAFPGVEEGEP